MFGNAQAYEQFMGRWSRLLAPALVEFANVPDEARVLDVGSGSGSLAFAIAQRRPRSQVSGIDPSTEYVQYANSNNPFPKRVEFRGADAQQMPFPDKTFDAGLSLLVFNFIPDPDKALQEIGRVTKPGGRISAATWDYSADMRMLRLFWDAVVSLDPDAEKRDEKHMPLCRAGELANLWERAGLEEVRESPLDVTMRFESFDDYWEPFLFGQGPAGAYVQSLGSPGRLKALRAEVRRRLPLTSDEAPFELRARAWAARGAVPLRS